ncbi:hypothetical protein [Actinomadura sp. WAC 06369]|uniref:hypothetical protein n=1 Tax=Actinomadura sp. WAC 06369 TaxID=2203193 RepID=UPI000F78ECCB|nr:hypothetical protein [Actinomadura sp. WAC 06369]RSN40024.1 hypothetical protein DMH08_39600 [Actinomadura sp. WAC 06369]
MKFVEDVRSWSQDHRGSVSTGAHSALPSLGADDLGTVMEHLCDVAEDLFLLLREINLRAEVLQRETWEFYGNDAERTKLMDGALVPLGCAVGSAEGVLYIVGAARGEWLAAQGAAVPDRGGCDSARTRARAEVRAGDVG